ncbi:acetylcholine receptor subunit beta-type unc-29-like [Symsagittifera roscoffensis]|uniref:acetylcholine receptor subunit beta-type unc-29-like n=1 Tax=Symsagittifera roscoffensis TaxID=84072 RepID=UPI00307C89D2
MKILRSFCILCFIFITCVAWRGYDVNPELYYENVEAIKRIFDTSRLQNYSTITLPTNPLTLYVKLIVQELIELDVKKEQLEVMGWMRLIWQDSRLSWSEEMFGIRELRVFPDNIWTPDVVIINSAQELPKGSHLPATVDSTGYVYWFLPARITTRCETDARFFPFDVQTCFIDLGSWTYSQELLQLTLLEYKTLLERVSQNIQWSITNIQASLVTAERFSEFHNKPMNFSKVQYSLTIERKPSFYVYCIFVPILLGASLGALTFLIPVDNGAKVSFPISMFLALFVNQLVINQFVPPSADTMPLVTILCTVLTSLFALNVAQTAIVLRVFHSGMNAHKIPVSYCLYTLLHFLENIGKRSFIYSHVYNPLHREVMSIVT